jgi:cytochrome oxidase assembly protein ShyY1
VYRFLLTPRWLAAAAVIVIASVVMVFLGNWQLHRYQERSAINDRIDAADSVAPVPLTSLLARPTTPGAAGPAPGEDLAWTKVTVSGRYDPAHEIQARGRTVDGRVGFEIVTPLVLADGTAVLVDRGWVPPAGGTAIAAPMASPPPTGTVTVEGQIHRSESRPAPVDRRDGRLDTRRIAVPRLAEQMPYPVYGAYVLLTGQTPAADAGYTRVPIEHEDAWQNGGYAVQWWLFAVMALVAFAWQARKEAHGDTSTPRRDRVAEADRRAPTDRVAEADRRSPADRATTDRVAEADRRSPADRATTDRIADADRRVADADRAAGPSPESSRAADAPAVPAARRPR